MKFTHILILTFTILTCASFQASRAAPQQMQRATCSGILDTGSGTAGSKIGDIEGKSCFLDADAAPERAVQAACKQGSRCEVVAMVTNLKNGNMQIQKVISAREMPTTSVKPLQPDLKSFAPSLSMFEGKWSDGNCNSRWNDWSITGLDIIFHDQSGGVDVERVVGVDPRGFRTQSVMASHGAVGGLWGYQPLASDKIRVQNISSGVTFYLRRCPSRPTVSRDTGNAANEAPISIPQPRTAAQDRTSVKIASFTVIVNFSPQARQHMTELGEYLTIDASFYGEPTQRGEQYADSTGRIQLGDAAQTMPMKSYASATFSGNGIDLNKLHFIKEEEPFVLINIYSARRTASKNLLDCDTFQDPVMIAARGPVTLVCRLIGEN